MEKPNNTIFEVDTTVLKEPFNNLPTILKKALENSHEIEKVVGNITEFNNDINKLINSLITGNIGKSELNLLKHNYYVLVTVLPEHEKLIDDLIIYLSEKSGVVPHLKDKLSA